MKSSAITLQRQDVRQAVVYVDAYSPNFRPFTLSAHMAFTPVLNVPAIDFTIELLIASSIEEVYLVSSKYDEKLKTYIDNNKWTKIKKVALTLFISESCLSLGDALREIYAKGSIKSDFILVNGLVISNLCLKPLLEIHKKRRQKDKVDTLMTLVFLQTKGRVPYDIKRRFALALDRQSDRILYFSPLKTSRIQIPMEVIDKAKQVTIACDLWHSDVSICSPQVPQFFADNFDYQNIPDFANDILVNEEILGSQIHVHIEETSYCFSLSNLPMYYRLSIDLLNDWFYPATPGKWRQNIALTDTHLYELRSRGVYLPKDSTQYRIAENSVLQQDVLIGPGTDIDSKSFITRSIIGSQCKIGRNTQIKNSIVCDSVVIGNECVINNSVLGRGVTLHDGVHLKNGSALNQNIIVGPYLQFPDPTIFHHSSDELKDFCMSIKKKNRPWPADAIIALEKPGHGFYVKLRFVEPQAKPLSTDQYDSTLEVPITSSYKSCGTECLLYTPPPIQQPIPLGHVLSADNIKKTEGGRRKNSQSSASASMGNESDTSSTTSTSSADKHGDYDDSDASSTTCSLPEPGQIGSDFINTLENDDLALAPTPNSTRADNSSFEDAYIPDDLKAFYSELYESFQRCEEDAIPLKNLILEINSSKHAYNVNLQDLWFCIAKIVFTPTTAIAFGGDQDRNASFNHYKKRLNYYNDLLNNYFKTQESQVVFLSTFVESLTQQGEQQPALQANFSKLLHHMYHADIVTEEAIMLWFKSSAKQSLPSNLFVHAEAFVKWLEEAEEDSADED